jgi:transposase-like protein
VSGQPEPGQQFEVVCPHCKKPFTGELMSGSAARHHGFKCPHCRLFVPYQRVEERNLLDPVE